MPDTRQEELPPTVIERPKTLAEAKNRGAGVPMNQVGGSFLPAFTDVGQVMEFAALMASAGPMVGKVCRGNPGACAAVIMMAGRFSLDPFLLSHKAYQTNDNAPMAWEAQAINAMIMGANALEEPLDYSFEGEGTTRKVTVVGRLRGTTKERSITTNTLGNIKVQNSPNWKSEPDQQLAYYGSRLWIRRHAPHVLMGVYSRDEVEAIPGSFTNVTPERTDPVTRLQNNLKAGRPRPEEPEPEPDPPTAAAAAPVDEPEEEDADPEIQILETGTESGEASVADPAAEESGSQPAEAPPHPGELVRTKKGGLEYAQRWAPYWAALPADAEEAFLAETEALTDLAKSLNPAAVDIIDDAFNAPKGMI